MTGLDPEVMTLRQTQMVALSMVYAAAQLVHLLATQGSSALVVHQEAFHALITAALLDQSNQTEPCQRYGYPKCTQLGFRTLERCLIEPYSSTPAPRQPEPLNQPATIDLIRACLFAGMRAAQVWHQLGGRRWMLWLHRRPMVADLRELAVRQYRGTRTRH